MEQAEIYSLEESLRQKYLELRQTGEAQVVEADYHLGRIATVYSAQLTIYDILDNQLEAV